MPRSTWNGTNSNNFDQVRKFVNRASRVLLNRWQAWKMRWMVSTNPTSWVMYDDLLLWVTTYDNDFLKKNLEPLAATRGTSKISKLKFLIRTAFFPEILMSTAEFPKTACCVRPIVRYTWYRYRLLRLSLLLQFMYFCPFPSPALTCWCYITSCHHHAPWLPTTKRMFIFHKFERKHVKTIRISKIQTMKRTPSCWMTIQAQHQQCTIPPII